MKNDEKRVSLDTMVGIGKKKTIAGREYTILPVNIRDMRYVIGTGVQEDDEKSVRLIILSRKEIETNKDVDWQIFGLNIVDEERKKVFLEIINKYLYYKDFPMTEELLVEHNWSFKEIGEFLLTWAEVSD